jgi:uncharacterized metal-binding protein YceD (DUF177 family)
MSKKSEYIHIVLVEDITKKPEDIDLTPSQDEVDNICGRLELKGLDILKAKVSVKRKDDGCTIYAKGSFSVEVTQECVVSLEPVSEKLNETFEAYYLDDTKVKSFESAKRLKQVNMDEEASGLSERRMPELHEEPELIRDGKINIGELLIQSISLSLNPYPRKGSEDEESKPQGDQVIYEDKKESPFAVLKDHLSQKKT